MTCSTPDANGWARAVASEMADPTDTAAPSTVTAEAIRAELASWLEANWDPELGLAEWRRRLAVAGWAVPSWPERWYGRGCRRGPTRWWQRDS